MSRKKSSIHSKSSDEAMRLNGSRRENAIYTYD
jgi:hypothetical protein